MTKLAAGYLNRARIARHIKARAVEAQHKAWSNGHSRNDQDIAETASKPRDSVPSGQYGRPLIPTA